jgi:hypothetical protein
MEIFVKVDPPDPVCPLSLIWCNPEVGERDWIKYLLQGVPTEDVVLESIPMPKPGFVYIIDSNKISPDDLAEKIGHNIDANRPVGLIHLSDEWCRGNYRSYRLYDFIIRTYHARILEKTGVLIVPLGWPNNGEGAKTGKLATDRQFKWYFSGYLKSSRFEMLKAFQEWKPNACRIYNTKGGNKSPPAKEEYSKFLNDLSDTVFCPAPMGSVMAETWRLYEALEAGCIPLAECRLTMDYYFNLFGNNPIPRFRRWRDARSFAERLVANPGALIELQSEIQQWWSEYKYLLIERVKGFVCDGLRGSFRRELCRWRFPPGPASKMWQISELARHHSAEALMWRVNRNIRRGIGVAFE